MLRTADKCSPVNGMLTNSLPNALCALAFGIGAPYESRKLGAVEQL